VRKNQKRLPLAGPLTHHTTTLLAPGGVYFSKHLSSMNTTGTIPRKPNTGTPRFEADPMNSTYRWELYLTAGLKGNRVPLMDGYSKGMGFENTNKVELLYRKLVNPLLPYLSKCDVIIIYEQNRGLPKDMHPKLLELYPHSFGAHGWVKETPVITNFLETYYSEYVRTGTMPPVEDRRKNVRQPFYMADLDHSKHSFKDQEELKKFCSARVEKYSAQCMTGWYYRHADFQPELFENDVTEALTHTVHTAKTAEAAAAAMSAMHGKYPSNR
jgi:hypothetical protein